MQSLRNSVGALKRGWLPLVDRRYLLVVRAAIRCAYLTREIYNGSKRSAGAVAAIGSRITSLRASIAGDRGGAEPTNTGYKGDALAEALLDALDRLASYYAATKGGRSASS